MYEQTKKAARTASLATALILAVGCASSEQSRPTHYWESTVSKRTYHQDHDTCGAPDPSTFDADSAGYQEYRDCMISKGYTLRSY